MSHIIAFNHHDKPMNNNQTITGNYGLQIEEPLLFELHNEAQNNTHHAGVDLPKATNHYPDKLGVFKRATKTGLPNISEPQVVRHFTRLSQKNYAIDLGLYPLGSCTMKHNPRLNEKVARLPGLARLHPLQPYQTCQGGLDVLQHLTHWLKELTGLEAVALSPAAGAHGELCGIMAIKKAFEVKGETRRKILIPESAHGTNPATAAACGFEVVTIPMNEKGRTDVAFLKSVCDEDTAAIMLTNPNTCGLFENDILAIAEIIHAVGGYFYCDGANFNAIVGKIRPKDLGVDVMHINLHKTFSTPHGGGGPGSGPVVFCEALAPYIPLPWLSSHNNQLHLLEFAEGITENSIGRIKGFHGQMGMFIRALSYMMSHGADGLRQVAEDAVLNANYIKAKLKSYMSVSFDGPSMHEVLFDDRFLKSKGISTLDFAKALIDEGFHPMTMDFPLGVSGALLVEPTETESKESLDQFIDACIHIIQKATTEPNYFKSAPYFTPRKRLDETKAARTPHLRWKP